MGLAVLRQREPQSFLGAGLADRTGDADHFGVGPRARRGGKVAQAGEHIRHDKQRRVGGKLRAPVGGDDGERGFCRERPRHEIMAVAMSPEMAKNASPGVDAAAVDRNAGNRLRQRALPLGAHRCRHRVHGPQRRRAHAASSFSAVATAS